MIYIILTAYNIFFIEIEIKMLKPICVIIILLSEVFMFWLVSMAAIYILLFESIYLGIYICRFEMLNFSYNSLF